jgi:hypothetical protein
LKFFHKLKGNLAAENYVILSLKSGNFERFRQTSEAASLGKTTEKSCEFLKSYEVSPKFTGLERNPVNFNFIYEPLSTKF